MPVPIAVKNMAIREVVCLGISGVARLEVVQIRYRRVLSHEHVSLEPIW